MFGIVIHVAYRIELVILVVLIKLHICQQLVIQSVKASVSMRYLFSYRLNTSIAMALRPFLICECLLLHVCILASEPLVKLK